MYAVIRRRVTVGIPWRSITKYVLASAVMAMVLFIVPSPTRISLTLIVTAAGGLVYLGLLMAMDEEARLLVQSMWEEVRFKIYGLLS